MLWSLFRWREDRRRLRRRMRDVCPSHTGKALVALISFALVACLLLICWTSLARAEGKVMYVATETDPLNVRERPSTRAPWVFQMDQGEALNVYEVKDGWAYVERTGDYGWASMKYLSETPLEDELPDDIWEVELE